MDGISKEWSKGAASGSGEPRPVHNPLKALSCQCADSSSEYGVLLSLASRVRLHSSGLQTPPPNPQMYYTVQQIILDLTLKYRVVCLHFPALQYGHHKWRSINRFYSTVFLKCDSDYSRDRSC
jgi:hypothetical protein